MGTSQSLKAPAKGSKAPQNKGERKGHLSDAQIIIAPHPPSLPPSSFLQPRPEVKEFLRLKRLIQDNEDLCAKKKGEKKMD